MWIFEGRASELMELIGYEGQASQQEVVPQKQPWEVEVERVQAEPPRQKQEPLTKPGRARERWWYVDMDLGTHWMRYDERLMCELFLKYGRKWTVIANGIYEELGIRHRPQVISWWLEGRPGKSEPKESVKLYLLARMQQLGYANKTKEELEAEVGRQAFSNDEVPMSKVASQKLFADLKGWGAKNQQVNVFQGQVFHVKQAGEE